MCNKSSMLRNTRHHQRLCIRLPTETCLATLRLAVLSMHSTQPRQGVHDTALHVGTQHSGTIRTAFSIYSRQRISVYTTKGYILCVHKHMLRKAGNLHKPIRVRTNQISNTLQFHWLVYPCAWVRLKIIILVVYNKGDKLHRT